MAIQLTKDNTASPDAYSDGDGSDPIVVALTLDGTNTPTNISGSPVTDLFVWANDDTGNIDNYSNIVVSIEGADAGIVWEVSLNNTDFSSSISVPTLDVSITHATTQIYTKATAINDGSVLTANYTAAGIKIAAVENPA